MDTNKGDGMRLSKIQRLAIVAVASSIAVTVLGSGASAMPRLGKKLPSRSCALSRDNGARERSFEVSGGQAVVREECAPAFAEYRIEIRRTNYDASGNFAGRSLVTSGTVNTDSQGTLEDRTFVGCASHAGGGMDVQVHVVGPDEEWSAQRRVTSC